MRHFQGLPGKSRLSSVSPKPKSHHCSCWRSLDPDSRAAPSRFETRLNTNQRPLPQTAVPKRGSCSNENDSATWRMCFRQNLQQRLQPLFPWSVHMLKRATAPARHTKGRNGVNGDAEQPPAQARSGPGRSPALPREPALTTPPRDGRDAQHFVSQHLKQEPWQQHSAGRWPSEAAIRNNVNYNSIPIF